MTEMTDLVRRVIAALAILTVSACGAHSFSLGGGAPTSPGASPPGYSTPTGLTSGGDDRLPIDPDDPITSATDRANASTPNNAGRARTYPQGDYHDAYFSYGRRDHERGDGYYVENRHRLLILAGYPVEEAIRRAKAAGFGGQISVSPFTDGYEAGCAPGTVCQVIPTYWQLHLDGELILYVNRGVKISSPD